PWLLIPLATYPPGYLSSWRPLKWHLRFYANATILLPPTGEMQMAHKGKSRGAASLKTTSTKIMIPQKSKPVALTVKVDDETYVRLCTLGAIQRRTNQEILCEALHEYLERVAG
ncbi:MAG: hypothetical protein C5B54_09255, partial [Acidobacteria bacterium]